MRGLEEPIQVDKGDAETIERAMATALLIVDDIGKANLASRLKRRCVNLGILWLSVTFGDPDIAEL